MAEQGQLIKASAELLQQYDTLFGVSKNIARAIPNVQDGLKPVQRKILYVMNQVARDNTMKVGTIVGEVLKIYKHGDISVSDALVRLAAPWGNIYPYITGVGNFGCHDDQTEVLTDRGWVLFKNLTQYDLLATVNPINHMLAYTAPKNIMTYILPQRMSDTYTLEEEPFTMMEYSSPDLDFCVTTNHKMLVGRDLTEIKDLVQRQEYIKLDNHIQKSNGTYFVSVDKKPPLWIYEIPENSRVAFMYLMGIYFNLGKSSRNAKGEWEVRLYTEENAYLTGFMDAIQEAYIPSLNLKKESYGYSVHSDAFLHLISTLQMDSDLVHLRTIPDDFLMLDTNWIEAFLSAYQVSCGEKYDITTYYASNKVNADMIQLLSYMCGKVFSISQLEKYQLTQLSGKLFFQYKVSSVNSVPEIDMKNIQVKKYTGLVYCAEVPEYHTLITRRNGKILISGNSVMGDPHAAARYIEAKLSDFAKLCYFTDKLCIEMEPTDDGLKMEPKVLPSMFPTAIINGATGSGFGQSTNIPQYNLKDVINKTIELIDDPHAPGYLIPDSQWGCDISNSKVTGKYKTSFEHIYETGYGCYVQSFRYQIDHQKNIVIVTALPAKILLEEVLQDIERLQKQNNAFPELKSMADYSGKDHHGGVWVEFALYEGKNPYRFISKLATVRNMRKTVKVNIDLVDELEVKHYTVRSYILAWYHNRYDYIRSVLATQLTEVNSDIAINNIKLFILGKGRLERTVEIFRNVDDKKEIIEKLLSEYAKDTGMTSQQAAILAEMSGIDYTRSALRRYEALKPKLQRQKEELEQIITSKDGISNMIKDQLRQGLKFARPRGAKIIGKEKAMDSDTVVLAINPNTSSIIKLPDNEDSQKLVSSLPSSLCLSMDTSYNAIVFDSNGRYVVINPGEIPMMESLDQMVPINRYIDKQLSTMIAMECQDENCKNFMVLTKYGKVKRIDPSLYRNTKNNMYIGLDDSDSVVSVLGIKNEKTHVIAYTKDGNGQRFPCNIISITSANAAGTYGMILEEGDALCGGFCVTDSDLIAYVTRKGMIRINHSRYFLPRKNKRDWVHLIDVKSSDALVAVVTCTSHDTLRIVYSDFTTKDIPVSEIPVDTMNSPMRNLLYQPHKYVLNVKRTINKKKK